MSAVSEQKKTILFIGCGSFGDVEVALAAHPKWDQKVTATELRTFNRSSDSCPDCTKSLKQPVPWQIDPSGKCYVDLERTFAKWVIDDETQTPQLVMNLPQDLQKHLPQHAVYNFTLNLEDGLFPSVSRIEILGIPQEHHAESMADYTLKLTCNERCRRIKKLHDLGVEIILGVDGTNLHEFPHPSLKDRSFRHIYWNCPHDGSSFKAQTLPPLLSQVVASAARVQAPGSKLHISIPQPTEPYDKTSFFQGYVYDLVKATKTYYTLYKKRTAGTERYPNYVHETTNEGRVADSAKRLREFVFIRKGLDIVASKAKIERKEFYKSTREYYTLETDEEYSSEEE